MKIVSARLEGELETFFDNQLAIKHKAVSDLLRDIITEYRAITENPIGYLVNQPSFQKLLGLAVETDLEIKREKAKLETQEKIAELKEKERKQKALDRAAKAEKVDWGDSAGGSIDGAERGIIDGFSLGDQ